MLYNNGRQNNQGDSMFIDEQDTIKIIVYYKKTKQRYTAYSGKEYSELKEDERGKCKSVNITAKQLSWGLFNELQESAIVRGVNGERFWNFKLYKENKLKNIILDWDAKRKNAKGEEELVPINTETINKLAPEIAEMILSEYDSLTTLDDVEEKK